MPEKVEGQILSFGKLLVRGTYEVSGSGYLVRLDDRAGQKKNAHAQYEGRQLSWEAIVSQFLHRAHKRLELQIKQHVPSTSELFSLL